MSLLDRLSTPVGPTDMQLLVWDQEPHSNAIIGSHPGTNTPAVVIVADTAEQWRLGWVPLSAVCWKPLEGVLYASEALAKQAAQQCFNEQQAVDMQDILIAAKPL